MSARVCHFKLVLLGDTAVGKSCLVVRFVRDEFFEFQEPTIGGTRPLSLAFLFSLSLAAFLTQSVATELQLSSLRYGTPLDKVRQETL